ncbi:protein EMBRYO DEFECTIVE 514 [Salvia divinorum]|uniref:Protein EMBRYO DEFECTIVE 514 n=1 Tax=Salvia divinorum TaxID=28513 RepID=A0ABD1HAL1_SALDI
MAASEASMEVEEVKVPAEDCDNGAAKRSREEDVEAQQEEKRTKTEDAENGAGEGEPIAAESVVGPKTFDTSVAMFDYFFKLLHFWSPNLNVNKYEYLVLLDLLKKGHVEADRKIGVGVKAFQVRFHPQFKSRCFFLIREDDSVDDFSFRKCVDHISPLPDNMQVKHDANKALRGKGGGRGRGGRGRGRGWK